MPKSLFWVINPFFMLGTEWKGCRVKINFLLKSVTLVSWWIIERTEDRAIVFLEWTDFNYHSEFSLSPFEKNSNAKLPSNKHFECFFGLFKGQ